LWIYPESMLKKGQTELLRSLAIGAQDMLDTEVPFEPDALMTTISIPDPNWSTKSEAL
jgi:hypothetical protein